MSFLKKEDEKKWLNAFVAFVSIILAFVVVRFVGQLGEWFDLEAKIQYFRGVSQGIGIFTGLITFIVVSKHQKAKTFLDEVYSELLKVIWPDKDSVVKMTIGIIIGISIVSSLLVLVDYIFKSLLGLLY
jgi:preprotein translocase subunit SecE